MRKYAIILSVVFVMLAAFAMATVKMEYDDNGMFRQILDRRDYAQFYNEYIIAEPVIEGRPAIGVKSAQITIIEIVDLKSAASLEFYDNTFKYLKEHFIDSGDVTYHYKFYLTKEDVEQRSDRYERVMAAYCYYVLRGAYSEEFHGALLTSNLPDVISLSADHGVESLDMEKCIDAEPPTALYADMIEARKFRIWSPSIFVGIKGESNTVLYGEPSANLINRTIRQKQIRLGI